MREILVISVICAVVVAAGLGGIWLNSISADRCEKAGGEYAKGICFKPGVLIRN